MPDVRSRRPAQLRDNALARIMGHTLCRTFVVGVRHGRTYVWSLSSCSPSRAWRLTGVNVADRDLPTIEVAVE